MRQWKEKEKDEHNSQMVEQQRILKNLKHVNRVARNQAQKAVKQAKKEKMMQANDNFKIIKSARHKSRDRMP